MTMVEGGHGLREDVSVPQDAIDSFRADGAVLLKGYFRDWVDTLRAGIERNLAEPGPYQRVYTPQGSAGRFVGDYCNWARIPEYRQFVLEGAPAGITGQLITSRTCR